jgi:tetratricopeptide (TPR) repeat protein
MCANPLEFANVLYRTATAGLPRVEEYLGKLGWAELRLTNWVYLPELILLAAVCVWDFGPRAGMTNRQALVAAAVVLLVSLTIAVVMHLTWDKVGAAAIALHGRYFIPVGPLAAVVIGRAGYLVPHALRKLSLALPAVTALAVPVLLTVSLAIVHDRYYVDTPKDAADRACVRGRMLLEEGGEGNLTPARMERARASLEDAIRIDPDHFAAHQLLGLLLVETSPGEAAEHFRICRRLNPGDSMAAYELGKLLASRAELAEAIRLFREALKLNPGNAHVGNDLRAALQKQQFLDENLPRIGAEFRALVGEKMVERRYEGTPKEGLYFKPDRGRVAATAGQPLLTSFGFQWRIPPPSGTDVRFSGAPAEGDRAPFYACSKGQILTKRLFVFPPATCELLADEDVSWFYQLPLTALNPREVEKERAYRSSLGLRFPLANLPE